MCECGYGWIVNVVFIIGICGSNLGEVVYSVVKVGLVGWSMGLVLEVVKSGIMVNSVVLGWIVIVLSIVEECQVVLVSFSGCVGWFEEVVVVVVFFVLFEVSFVNGELLVVDGGNCLIENKWS